MSRQKDISDYISTRLNANTVDLEFKLYYKYGIDDGEFSDLLLQSTNSGVEADDIDVMYDGETTITTNGEYELVNVKYIPCIIEAFEARFEPLDNYDIIDYTVPVSFFVEERYNANNGDKFTEAIEQVQDAIRGRTNTISGFNTYQSHSALTPMSGLIEIGGDEEDIRHFRVYQVTFYFSMTKQGYFGRDIQYFLTNNNLFEGEPTRVYPVRRVSDRSTQTQDRQTFNTELNEKYEIKSIPDMSAFSLELTFVYEANELSRHFITQKYNQEKPQKYTFSIIYPGMEGTPFYNDYILTNVSGLEDVDEKLSYTLTFTRASDKYNG